MLFGFLDPPSGSLQLSAPPHVHALSITVRTVRSLSSCEDMPGLASWLKYVRDAPPGWVRFPESSPSGEIFADVGNHIIDGRHSTAGRLHQTLVDAAAAHIDMIHRAPCTRTTPVLFFRMDYHGIGNDLTRAVHALATAIMKGRQLVLLPPLHRLQSTFPSLKRTSWTHPWHWLASAELPTSTLLVTSSCQRFFGEDEALLGVMQKLSSSDATEADAGATLRRFGELELFNSSLSHRTNWRVGMGPSVIPLPFRKQGLLWWFQVLTSYFVRVLAPLRHDLQEHPGLQDLLLRHPNLVHTERSGGSGLDRRKAQPHEAVAAAIGRARCGRGRACDRIGPGWLPNVWFDVGLHIRRGDACGATAPKRGQRARRCSSRPLEDAFALMSAHGLRGSVFLATDSAEIALSAKRVGAAAGFNVLTLQINRTQLESLCSSNSATERSSLLRCGTEFVTRTRERDRTLLAETLLDALLLSRSTVLVGSMMSNFPRLALQLRVQMPLLEPVPVLRYLALDGRKWCTRSSCRLNYSDIFGTV